MEKIQEIISEIHGKVGHLKLTLDRVETDNEKLRGEINVLRDKLAKSEQEAAEFRDKYDAIKEQLTLGMQSNTHSQDEEIDLLVREIDECINRLKAE